MTDTKPSLFRVIAAVVVVCALSPRALATTGVFGGIRISQPTINPALGDDVRLTATLLRPGTITVQVVDRDGYLVRTLAKGVTAPKGPGTFRWDGRDERGLVVPDEAYSFRIDWRNGAARATYFPADELTEMKSVDADYYAARTATLAYTLPVASRVHVQAGVAAKNPQTGEMEGPVMRTLVNREPRAAGRIAEPWNGFDESGAVNVADLRDFVIAIAITPLPANSVITYGNRGTSFAEAALTRTGKSLLAPRGSHQHHGGLSVLDDVSPRMTLEPLNATWSPDERAWRVDGATLRVRVALAGPSAAAFARQPSQVHQFVDGKLVSKIAKPAQPPVEMTVPLGQGDRPRIVSLNWRSDYGGVAVQSLRVLTGSKTGAATSKGVR